MSYLKKLNISTIIYLNALIFIMCITSSHANLPVFIKEQGISTTTIGNIVSATPLASIIFSLPFSIISDRFSRKAVIFAGLFFNLLFCLTLLFANDSGLFYLAKVFEGMAVAAFLPASTAYISDLSGKEDLAKNIGKLTAIIGFGLIISPVISAIIAQYDGIRSVFVFLFSIAIINLLLSIFIFKNKERIIISHNETQGTSEIKNSEPVKNLIPLIAVGIFAVSIGYAQGLYDAIWALYLHECGTKIWLINLSYTFYAVPVALISTFIGKLSDKYKELGTPLLFGGLLASVSQISYAIFPVPIVLALISGVEGAGYAMFYPTSNTAMVQSVGDNFKGRALGSFNLLRTGGCLIGAIISARLYTNSSTLPFLICAAFMSISSYFASKSLWAQKPLMKDQLEPAQELQANI